MSTSPLFTIGALGDSISIAFNAEKSGANAEHSWASGNVDATRGASHFRRLQRLFPALDVRAVNTAFNGARATDLKAQVDRLLVTPPDYVTCLIGANDLPRWLAGEYGYLLDTFVKDVRAAVKRLIAANPRVMILLAAIPDQSRVVHLLAASGIGGAAAPYLAALAESPQLKVITKAYKERWARTNAALEEVAVAHPANVRFVPATAAATFTGEHLSPLDSYHPSVAGQRLLADITWNSGFFPS